MTDFWWFAALTVLAVLFIVWPLLGTRREALDQTSAEGIAERVAFNQALYEERMKEYDAQRNTGELTESQYEKLTKEAQKQLAQDNDVGNISASFANSRSPWVVLASAVVLPLVSFALYYHWGAVQDWQIHQLIKQKSQLEAREAPVEQIRGMATELKTKLENRVEQTPDNLNSWIMLARTAFEVGDFPKAIEAYQHILDEKPESPQVLTELAQVIYVGSGNQFLPEVKTLFDRALSFDPQNTQILGLAGFDAFQAGQYQTAIDYWQRVLNIIPKTDSRYSMWEDSIARAKSQMGTAPAVGDSVTDSASDTEAGAASTDPFIMVKVDLSADAKAAVSPDDPVFVYARAWQGAKMPLAMARITVKDLPAEIRLDESTAMAPGMTITQFPTLEVIARVAKQGTAQAQSGDWTASAGPIDTAPDQQATLTINTLIP